VELSNALCIVVLLDLRQIAVLGLAYIFILDHFIELTLLPSVFDAPIELVGGALFFLFLILGSVAVFSVLAELSLRLFVISPGSSSRKRPSLKQGFYHLWS